jgi:hypothetical protein
MHCIRDIKMKCCRHVGVGCIVGIRAFLKNVVAAKGVVIPKIIFREIDLKTCMRYVLNMRKHCKKIILGHRHLGGVTSKILFAISLLVLTYLY